MTHEEISLNTKHAFAAALKELLKEKPLNKITVKDLTERCAVNRKTFYYHFTDIYDLLKWIFEEEAVDIIKKFDMVTDFRDAALFVIEYIEENMYMINCVYDSMGREELKNFLFKDFIQIIEGAVDEYEKVLGLELGRQYKYFVCIFYAEAIAGVIIDWIKDPHPVDRETALDYIETVIFSAVPDVLRAGEKFNKPS